MIISMPTNIPFRPRTETQQGEIIKVRDGAGRLVEVWECLSAKSGRVTFDADGYRVASEL